MEPTQDEINRKRVETEEDFIVSPKHSNSLKRLLKNYPDGLSNAQISKYLDMTEEEVEAVYQSAIKTFKKMAGEA